MKPHPARCELLGRLRQLLGQGLAVTPSTAHFIDSTFGRLSADELAAAIAGDSDSERDSLVQLLFFPDEGLQVALEDLLARSPFNRSDETALAAALAEDPPWTAIGYPDASRPLRLRFPADAAEPFVARLNLCWRHAPGVKRSVAANLPAELQGPVLVRLRNAGTHLQPSAVALLEAFLAHFGREARQELLAGLHLVLECLRGGKPADTVYDCLVETKRRLWQQLQAFYKFERHRQVHNMETLMLRGVRAPCIDEAAAADAMRRVDRICRALFGRTQYFQPAAAEIDLGRFDREKDISAIMRLLS